MGSEKKRVILRLSDEEIFAAKIFRNDKDKLVISVKLHPRLEEVISSFNVAKPGDVGDHLRNYDGETYYRQVAEGLNAIMDMNRADLALAYPDIGNLTVGFTQFNFNPTMLYPGDNHLNFQILRRVGISLDEGAEMKIEGAITLGLCRSWLLVARSFAARIWQEYVYPVSLEATLTTREMAS